ncbi:MAG: hypothetical protein GX678_07590 [Actinomycetales bacterium]|nr:hypothetical protein [Actinomycetales bacterium]
MKILAVMCSFVLGFSLASCGSGSNGPDADAAPSASPTPTATLPAKPKGKVEPTAESAAQFISYWIDVQNYAFATGDYELLESISHPDCEGCNVLLDAIFEIYEEGGYLQNNQWSLNEFIAKPHDGGIQVTGTIQASKGELFYAGETTPTELKAMSAQGTFLLHVYGRGWMMTEFSADTKGSKD